ncbi:hypothetical protein MSG28_004342 [Choristoneura fumiferana]|uniref:Uncharacterized protein n=1 Tax=Choristoneura fumiferana TaxID=7141 RepID=A0ACC0KIL8_CHOFU|nr:hypothetical protein MSG28_004342 [Choristoneura fumiferana]
MALGIRSPIPLGAVATQIYRTVQAQGYGQKDFSFIYQLLKEDKKSIGERATNVEGVDADDHVIVEQRSTIVTGATA